MPAGLREKVAKVALRKESVDRNFFDIDTGELKIKSLSARRAWIEIAGCRLCGLGSASLSARRAWIEISWCCSSSPSISVALRKESVDRNLPLRAKKNSTSPSLSARRAWIEIPA